MKSKIDGFRESSREKFLSLPSESSQTFKYQTLFKDFDTQPSGDFSGSYEILEKPQKVNISDVFGGMGDGITSRFDIEDKFVQMNNAFFSGGIFIEIPKNMGDAGKIRIRSPLSGPFISKSIISIGDGSSVEIFKESSSKGAASIFSEDFIILTGSGSSVKFSDIQNNGGGAVFSNKISVCGPDSRVSWNTGVFGGESFRSRTYNIMEGDGSVAEDMQMVFGSGSQKFDTFSHLSHVGKSTSGRALHKGAFKDGSVSIAKGMINIGEVAKNASSYLSCHAILLGKNARANAIPGLEIKTNDVKATHSASVAPIDEEKVFYLKCRGIDDISSRKILTVGYFDPVSRRMESDEVRAKMRYLIESKWDGIEVESFNEEKIKDLMTEDAIKSGDMFEGHYKYR